MAWPTVVMACMQIAIMVAVYWRCGTGQWPLWLGLVLNCFAAYLVFSVGHDAVHRAISTNIRLNDLIGHIGMGLVLPYVDIRMFRWVHSRHHRYANEDHDPDSILHGAWWSLPFRWMLIDVLYVIHAFKYGDRVSKPFLRNCLLRAAAVAIAFTLLVRAGYGTELFMLWFIPSRFGLLALGFVFFWLPHVPHDVTQADNFTRATTVRLGHEWLLSPILQYQNYHLIHHLYPLTPFYNNRKVYQLIEPELRHHDMAIQRNFAIQPFIQPAS